jgi:hypothetical protein
VRRARPVLRSTLEALVALPLVGIIHRPDQREDHNRSQLQEKVYAPQSGRPTRSGPVRQDTQLLNIF